MSQVQITDEAVTAPCIDCGKPVSFPMDTLKRIYEQFWEPRGAVPKLDTMAAKCNDCAERDKGKES